MLWMTPSNYPYRSLYRWCKKGEPLRHKFGPSWNVLVTQFTEGQDEIQYPKASMGSLSLSRKKIQTNR